jgi:hypothetical protein
MFGLGDLGTGFLNRHISGHTVYVLEVNINEKLVMRELNCLLSHFDTVLEDKPKPEMYELSRRNAF